MKVRHQRTVGFQSFTGRDRIQALAEIPEALPKLMTAEGTETLPAIDHRTDLIEALRKVGACMVARAAPSVLVHVYCSGLGDGGVGFRRRAGASRLEGGLCLYDLSALHLRRRSALSHPCRLQHPPATAPPGRASQEEMQAVGSDVARRSWMVSRSWLSQSRPHAVAPFQPGRLLRRGYGAQCRQVGSSSGQ